ncbi:MAG: right-handed parallel beta-helix repeat-containing protein [Sedimentisphaerales bacterium]|nr:right-handed parallel beta-helix repeat-containing protein [Sedimentisphaerales bacterium]
MFRPITTLSFGLLLLVINTCLWSQPFDTVYVDPGYPNSSPYFNNFQDAIDDVAEDGMVWVNDGTYTGAGNHDIEYRGKRVTVQSYNGPTNCIIDCQWLYPAFLFINGEDPCSVLDGFTIRYGEANTNIFGTAAGGGMYFEGIFEYSSPTIKNCIISYCNSSEMGGGIHCDYNSSPKFINCRISGNSAWFGGGASIYDTDNVIFIDCTINSNISSNYGGGIFIEGFDDYPTDALFDGCVISNNTAVYAGGGLECSSWSDTIIVNSVIRDNRAFFSGGGIDCYNNVSTDIIHTTIVKNIADYGGALACDSYLYNGNEVTIVNSILWDNTTDEDPNDIWNNDDSDILITYSDVEGGWGNPYMTHNIDADPMFLSSSDYHLTYQSPCIDIGTYIAGLTVDIEDNDRPMDVPGIGQEYTGTEFDLGAYEIQTSPVPGMPDLISDTGQKSDDDITNLNNADNKNTLEFIVNNTIEDSEITLYADGYAIGSETASGTSTSITTDGSYELTNGPHLIQADQTVPGESASALSPPLNIIIDANEPVINSFNVDPDELQVGSVLYTIEMTATDEETGIDPNYTEMVTIRKASMSVNVPMVFDGDDGFTGTWSNIGYDSGAYWIDFKARDIAGNEILIIKGDRLLFVNSPEDLPDIYPFPENTIDMNDLYYLVSYWLSTENLLADVYPDGIVDMNDFCLLSEFWLASINP